MKIHEFLRSYTNAFGNNSELPSVFWFSRTPANDVPEIKGCLFKLFKNIREGKTVSINVHNISCGEGKFYKNNTEMPEKSPLCNILNKKRDKFFIIDFLCHIGFYISGKRFLNIARIDNIDNFENINGLLFFASEENLPLFASWAYHGNGSENAVTTLFNSGSCAIIKDTVLENRRNGKRTFVGVLDHPVRNNFGLNNLCFAIPMSRFQNMYQTILENDTFEIPVNSRIQEKINDFRFQKFFNPIQGGKQASEINDLKLFNPKFLPSGF